MTAETDLLPLDMPRRFEFTRQEVRALARDYARANIAHATVAKDAEIEALRAEVERAVEVAQAGARLVEKAARQRNAAVAHAERLAEALRIAIRQNSHDMLMTGDELRQCEAALNPTAARENDDA